MNKALTIEDMKRAVDKIMAEERGFKDGKAYDMSEPKEPSFEDDFDVDTDPPERWEQLTLMDIAITKAHAFAQEYNTHTGRVEDKPNYHALKEGYTAGFLEGFSHRFTTNDKVSE